MSWKCPPQCILLQLRVFIFNYKRCFSVIFVFTLHTVKTDRLLREIMANIIKTVRSRRVCNVIEQ